MSKQWYPPCIQKGSSLSTAPQVGESDDAGDIGLDLLLQASGQVRNPALPSTHQIVHLTVHVPKSHNFLAQYLHSMLLLLIEIPV